MKILYGIQGTGNGHITRARHMASALSSRRDITVDYFFSGRDKNAYFDMATFGDFTCARGLTFVTQNGRIDYHKSVTQNNLFNFVNEIKSVIIKEYDLVINDFEPVTAWAAKKAGVPSLSVSHQAAFLHHVPKHKQGMFDKFITRYFAPTKHSLGTHWYHFGYDIIPPFVPKELIEKADDSRISEDVLVYLPFENPAEISEQLHFLSDYKFICHHPDVSERSIDKNVEWRPLSTHSFKQTLGHCSGVISNCGFELSTECLSLGKPLLVKPLARQYEQLSNAFTLQELGASHVMHQLDSEAIDDWLQQRASVKIEYPTNCDLLIDWIANGDWENPSEIRKKLWESVKFPAQVRQRLLNFA
ncbi:MAG: MJ1255/VC2487 family glycosyltransferase [Pseudomonadota bacterium]